MFLVGGALNTISRAWGCYIESNFQCMKDLFLKRWNRIWRLLASTRIAPNSQGWTPMIFRCLEKVAWVTPIVFVSSSSVLTRIFVEKRLQLFIFELIHLARSVHCVFRIKITTFKALAIYKMQLLTIALIHFTCKYPQFLIKYKLNLFEYMEY